MLFLKRASIHGKNLKLSLERLTSNAAFRRDIPTPGYRPSRFEGRAVGKVLFWLVAAWLSHATYTLAAQKPEPDLDTRLLPVTGSQGEATVPPQGPVSILDDVVGTSSLSDAALENGDSQSPGGTGNIGLSRLGYSFHIGSAHPLASDLDSHADSNIYVQFDLGYRLSDNLDFKGMLGFVQLTEESSTGEEHPHWLHGSVNLRWHFFTPSNLSPYVQLGPGVYDSKSGSTDAGWNLGIGARVPLNAPFGLEFGADYHSISDEAESSFLTLQIGVLFR